MASTILFVPGTGGSELFTPPSFFGLGPRIRVWLSYSTLVAGAWRWLALSPDGVTPTFPGVGILQPGPTLPAHYGIWISRMSDYGWTVYSAWLDWRGTLANDAARVVAAIQGLASQAPVNCIAHSRGGLVLRQALSILDGLGQLGLVGRCAGLGTPHQGSWDSASLLAGFQRSENLLSVLVSIGPGGLVDGVIAGGVRSMVLTWPVGYELLPSPTAPGSDPATIATVYDPAQWAASGVAASAAWLAAASARWASAPPVPAAAQWIDVVGSGVATPSQLLPSGVPRSPGSYSYTDAGDGTVLARWATQPGRLSITTPTGHSALVLDGRLMTALDQYLRAGLPASIVLPGPVVQ